MQCDTFPFLIPSFLSQLSPEGVVMRLHDRTTLWVTKVLNNLNFLTRRISKYNPGGPESMGKISEKRDPNKEIPWFCTCSQKSLRVTSELCI